MDESLQAEQSQGAEYMTGGEVTPPEQMPGENAESTPSVPQDGGKAQAPEFDPTGWPLQYKGRPIELRDRDHLITLAQKGYGFDQEIDRLKGEKQQLDEMRGRFSKYEDLESKLSENPALAQKIFDMAQNPAAMQDGEVNPDIVRTRQELEELKTWKDQWENKQADQDLERELTGLKSKYPNHNWGFDDGSGDLSKKILKHAFDNGINNLETAYRDFMWPTMSTQARADGLKQAQANQIKNKQAGKVSAPGAPPPPQAKPGYQRGEDYNDLAAKAIKRLGG